MRCAIPFFVLVCWLSQAVAQDAAKKDLEKFQGSWKAESMLIGGDKLPADDLAKFSLTCKGDKFIPADNPTDVTTIKLNPAEKPAAIDLTDNRKAFLGIYRLGDDKLTICCAEPDNARPKEFASPKGSNVYLLVLKREK